MVSFRGPARRISPLRARPRLCEVTYLEPSVLEEPVTVLSIKRRLAKQLGCSIFGLRLLHEDKAVESREVFLP